MNAVPDDDVDDPKRDGDLVSAEKFAGLVEAAGGSTAAARILKRSRNAVEKWATGKSRLPFDDVLVLALAVDGNLDRFANSGSDEVGNTRAGPDLVAGASPGEDYVELPRLRVQAAAGPGRFMAPGDDDPGQFLAARSSWLHSIGCSPAKTEALVAKGDSMEPTIRDGDTLLVDRSVDRIVDAGIYVVVVAGAVMVKRLTRRLNGSVVLSSDNPSHPPETVTAAEVNELLIVEGRVRWCGRLM